MGKAKKQGKGSTTSEGERNRLVKVRLSDEEVADVRVAAALEDIPVGQFCREAALQVARKVIADRYSGGR